MLRGGEDWNLGISKRIENSIFFEVGGKIRRRGWIGRWEGGGLRFIRGRFGGGEESFQIFEFLRRDGGFKGVFIVIIKIIFTEKSETAFKLRWSDDAEFFVNGGERAFKMELITSEGQLREETEFFSVTGLRGEDLAIFTEKFKSMIWILKMPAGSFQLK